MSLKGDVVIVTGSSSGVGASTALLLAERGCNVVINFSSNKDGAYEVKERCEAKGVEALVIQADVADDKDCKKLAGSAIEKWGRIDGLVNNAGTTKFCAHDDLDGLDKTDFLDIYSVNTVGPYQMVRAVAPNMRQHGKGAIVNVASVAGVIGIGSSIAYAASKGALITLGLSLARVLGPEIRINTVCPGFIQGDWLKDGMGEKIYEESKQRLESTTPLRLTTTPNDIANGIIYFLESAGVITGETLMLDGGFHLNQLASGRR